MTINIKLISDSEQSEWNRYVEKHVGAKHYHCYEWRFLFRDHFRKQTYYLAAYDDENSMIGILPIVRQKSWLFGDYLVSLPFLNYGGILCGIPEVESKLSKEACGIAEKMGVAHLELREQSTRQDFSAKMSKVSMCIDLPDEVEQLSKALGSKRRSQIKRPQRENPTIRIGQLELLDSFYSVFSRNMRDLGTPVYPKSMFEQIATLFPNDITIISIELDSRPAAAAFLIRHKDTMEIPWASTDRRFNNISINMLLYWEALKYSIDVGARVFDFGRCTEGSGSYKFKKQWGATATPLCWNYWLQNEGQMPDLSPQNAKYRLMISAWQKLPLRVSTLIGPSIVVNLP